MSTISSRPEDHGISPWSTVAVRIEGVLDGASDAEMYDVGLYHSNCADEGRKLFLEINEEDPAVMAFELDWSQPAHCTVCNTSIT